jgi:hypothetical protein
MKKTLIALAAAATVSLGTIGAASAASTVTSAGALDFTAQNGAAVQKVGHHFRHRYGYRYYGGYGYGYNARFYCKRLYYKGYVLGYGWARFKYVRHCAWRYGY